MGLLSRTEPETSLPQALDSFQKPNMILARIDIVVVAGYDDTGKLCRVHKMNVRVYSFCQASIYFVDFWETQKITR